MTNEPEMTLERCAKLVNEKNKRIKELEHAIKEAVDFVRMTRFKWDNEVVCGDEKEEDCDTHKFRVKANKFLESVRKVLP